MMGLAYLWVLMSGLLMAAPDHPLSQVFVKASLGGGYAWVWQDGGQPKVWSAPSMSMAPTLLAGDRMLSVKGGRPPRRGDIWVFHHPRSDRTMVKRIIGMPGDTVQVTGGRLYLNGKEVERTNKRTVRYRDEHQILEAYAYMEQLPDEARAHEIHEFSNADSLDETPLFRVPAGHLFFMGDNRDNSEDSRAPSGHRALAAQFPEAWPMRPYGLPSDPRDDAIGFVPVDNLIARVATVVFSLHDCEATDDAPCLVPKVDARL